ncbi:MAG: SIS domain-containing protein [Bacteroidales bacterium]|nr:SIS domain-containing protein [Bacteroidales bacterium]
MFNKYFQKAAAVLQMIDTSSLIAVSELMIDCYKKDACIYIMGNGGSGATAMHVAGDYIKGVSFGLEKRFRFISLNDNLAAILAIANDLSYDDIFVEQIRGGLKENDIVIGISGSGNSANVVKALEYAKSLNVKTIAFSGFKGGLIKKLADLSVHIPVDDMEIAEDMHLLVFHAIKQYIISKLKPGISSMGNEYDKRVNS